MVEDKQDNVFSKDIDIPFIVQKKADEAFLTIHTKRNHKEALMANQEKYTNTNHTHRFSGKQKAAGLAAAACAAVLIASGAFTGTQKGAAHFNTGHADPSVENTDTAKDALLNTIHQMDKMFTLQVKAAVSKDGQMLPLKKGRPVPAVINDGDASSWIFGSNADTGNVYYCINIPPLTCTGDQIKSITYSINNGAFQIIQPENEDSIILDGQPYDKTLNTGSIGGIYTIEGRPYKPYETVLYKSFTVDYNRQSDEDTWINICNELSDTGELKQLLWGDEDLPENFNKAAQKMLGHTVITCTVNYADNTSQSADIAVNSCLMTRKEAGEPLDPGMKPEELDEEITVITFELQK